MIQKTDTLKRLVDWSEGRWTNLPQDVEETCEGLAVTSKPESDAWRTTSYGFIHDSEHGLLRPFAKDSAIEVSFIADFSENFDQAGILLQISQDHWIKAGVEYSDGSLQLGAVVTNPVSDWSVAAVPEWAGQEVTVRVSWQGDALTVRAKAGMGEFRLVRLVPLSPTLVVFAGPYTCAPSRAGLTVTFTEWTEHHPDLALH